MIYLITFADNTYKYNQLLNKKSAQRLNLFDRIFTFSPKDIDKDFYEENRNILSQDRGCGYWLWKPYFILKVLNEVSEGDIVFYCDSGCLFIDSVEPLSQLLDKFKQDIIPFELSHIENEYTKRDTFTLMNCDQSMFTNTPQRLAGYIVLKNTDFSRTFVKEWLNYCQDPRIITDMDNTQTKSNYPEFIAHRNDQSIYSLLTKKYNLIGFRDPSQFGNSIIQNYPNLEYGQIINQTRYMSRLSTVLKKLNIPKPTKILEWAMIIGRKYLPVFVRDWLWKKIGQDLYIW